MFKINKILPNRSKRRGEGGGGEWDGIQKVKNPNYDSARLTTAATSHMTNYRRDHHSVTLIHHLVCI